MRMERREFIGLAAWSLAALVAGCARPPALQEKELLTLDPLTGATLKTQKVALPKGNRSVLDTGGQGFLLADGQSVLAVNFSGQTCRCIGPDDALWVRPNLLITADKTSSDLYRVSAVGFPDGQVVWRKDLGYGHLLGFDAQAVYVGHPKGITCFELEDGRERWSNPELTDLQSWCVLPSSLVVGLGNAGRVAWLDLKDGKMIRSLTTTTTPNRVILLAGDDDYTLTLTRRIAMAAFGPKQIGPLWVQPITGQDHQAQLLGYAQRIALVELHESTVAMDLVTGGTLWSDSLCTHLSICKDVVLLRRGHGGEGGKMSLVLEARQLRSGKSLWKRELQDLHTATSVNGEQFVLLTV